MLQFQSKQEFPHSVKADATLVPLPQGTEATLVTWALTSSRPNFKVLVVFPCYVQITN